MFVPGGWAHVVMNLDFSIAVTHNFCNKSNLESVYLHSRTARPKLASKLKRELLEYKGENRKYSDFLSSFIRNLLLTRLFELFVEIFDVKRLV